MTTLITELQNLDDGSVVLASSERVSRHLKMQAALLQSIAGKRSWFAKGKIATFSQWLEQLWLDLLPDEQLLYPVQELAVVKQVADRSGLLPENLISSTSTARRIAQAYSQFIKFKLPNDRDAFKFRREYEVFWQWKELIAEQCRKDGCIFRAELPGRVEAALREGLIRVPKKIVLVGVLYTNPSEQAVLDLMVEQGAELVILDFNAEAENLTVVRSVSQDDEFDHVAVWVNELLKPFVDTPHGAPSIAILVPDMNTYQVPLIEALTMNVSPAAQLPAVDGVEAREPWDISSGSTLGARPIIRTAMAILSLCRHKTDMDTFSRVLRSDWVGGSQKEGSTRALVDIWLRENQGLGMTSQDYVRALEACKTKAVDFTTRFKSVLQTLEETPTSLFPSEWADFFTRSLELMGWPEAEVLSSANYQTIEAWEEALKLFRSLDFQLGTCSYERAYMWLREITDTQKFQPRLGHVAPVAIMSYTDAVGLEFDHVWVLGATNQVMPMPADPNPFLPIELLSTAGVPEATSEGQLEKAIRLKRALLATAGDVTVSSPEHDDRGGNVGASELFGPWPSAQRADIAWTGFTGNEIGFLDRDQYDEEFVPGVSPMEHATLTGGVSIFKNYAMAPFFAFACNRLKADPFPKTIVGFDPRVQGTMLHLCLEMFWTEVRTQDMLKSFSEDELAMKVEECIELACQKLLYRLQWRYGRRLISLEKARLKSLLLEWMKHEAARTWPFEVVGFEEKTEVTVHGVVINITLDRIDRVSPPEEEPFDVLIDYKSGGNIQFSALNARNLLEPQLPIYATAVDPQSIGIKQVDGIALAQVNARQMRFHTRSNRTAHLEEGKPRAGDVATQADWEAQVAAWNARLSEMAQGFLSGEGWIESFEKALPQGYDHLKQII